MNDLVPMNEIKEMARAMGPLFSKKPDDMFALMLIAQAEGKHPAIAAQEYDIIQGRPAINSRSAQTRFQLSGGKVEWITRTDTEVSATFSHPQGGSLTITWDMKRAEQAGLTGKDNWKKYPAQMLASRVIAEGVRAVFPACLSGLYTIEEVQDFSEPQKREPRNVNNTVQHEKTEQNHDDPIKGEAEVITEPVEDFTNKILEVGKEIAKITGAPGSPNGWTEEEKKALQLRELILQAKKDNSTLPVEIAFIRAEIADQYRGDSSWDLLVKDLIDAGNDKEALESIKAKLAGLES